MIKKLIAGAFAAAAISGSTVALSATPASATHNAPSGCVSAHEWGQVVQRFRTANPGPGYVHNRFDFRGQVVNSWTSQSGYDEIRHYRKCPGFDGGGEVQVWYDTYTYSNGRLTVYSLDRFANA